MRCVRVFLLLLLGCATAWAQPADRHPPIGLLFPLSGNYSAIGVDNKQGVAAALELSPHPFMLDFRYEDSKADSATSVAAFSKLVEHDGVLGVFAMRGPVGMAVNPLSKARGIPLLGGVGNRDFAAGNEFAFQFWSKSDDEGNFLAQQLAERGFKRVALLTAQDDWPSAVSSGLRAGLKGRHIDVVYDQEFVPAETGFAAALTQLKSRAPDAVFVNLGLAQLGPFFKQAHDQRLATAWYSNFWLGKKEVVEAAGAVNIEGVQFVEMDAAAPVFSRTIRTKFGNEPSAATFSSYAGALLLMQAFSEHPEIETSAALYKALLAQKAIHTADGDLPIVDRCVRFPLLMRRIADGRAR